MQLWYQGKRGDEDRTRHWVEEHRRRFRIEAKNDLFEEALNGAPTGKISNLSPLTIKKIDLLSDHYEWIYAIILS